MKSQKVKAVLLSATLCGLITSATADHYWWVDGDALDFRWGNKDNWMLQGTGDNQLPDDTKDTYITTSKKTRELVIGEGAVRITNTPLAIFDPWSTSSPQVIKTLYIGGWDWTGNSGSELTEHGNEQNAIDAKGILEVRDGKLRLDHATSGSPACYYMRLGAYGAKGVINQNGGKVLGCALFTMGFYHPSSRGIWNLNDGMVETFGFDIGSQGLGVVNMSGGTVASVRGDVDENLANPQLSGSYWNPDDSGNSNPDTGTRIGTGYHNDDFDYNPGVGVFNQVGGDVHKRLVSIGVAPGSSGILAVRKNSNFTVTENIAIGERGHGSLIQTGGTFTSKNVYLGVFESGYGELTLSGGTFHQNGAPGTALLIGRYEDPANDVYSGSGKITVLGSKATITVDGNYYQYPGSRAAFFMDDSVDHVSAIEVAGTAGLYPGSEIDIGFLKEKAQSSGDTNLWGNISEGDVVVLLTANDIVYSTTQAELEALRTDRAHKWHLDVRSTATGKELVAVYCPSKYTTIPPNPSNCNNTYTDP